MAQYQTLAEANTTSLDGIFTYVASLEGVFFIEWMLFTLFMVVMLGTYFSQQRTSPTGRGNFTSSFAVAGYFTAIISYFLMLIPNLISGLAVVTVTTIAILGTILLVMGKDD